MIDRAIAKRQAIEHAKERGAGFCCRELGYFSGVTTEDAFSSGAFDVAGMTGNSHTVASRDRRSNYGRLSLDVTREMGTVAVLGAAVLLARRFDFPLLKVYRKLILIGDR